MTIQPWEPPTIYTDAPRRNTTPLAILVMALCAIIGALVAALVITNTQPRPAQALIVIPTAWPTMTLTPTPDYQATIQAATVRAAMDAATATASALELTRNADNRQAQADYQAELDKQARAAQERQAALDRLAIDTSAHATQVAMDAETGKIIGDLQRRAVVLLGILGGLFGGLVAVFGTMFVWAKSSNALAEYALTRRALDMPALPAPQSQPEREQPAEVVQVNAPRAAMQYNVIPPTWRKIFSAKLREGKRITYRNFTPESKGLSRDNYDRAKDALIKAGLVDIASSGILKLTSSGAQYFGVQQDIPEAPDDDD